MKFFRVAATIASLCLLTTARADVRTILSAQTLTPPPDKAYTHFGTGVATEGGFIIALAATDDGRQAAFLYRRSNSTGQYVYRHMLQSVTDPNTSPDVAMKNGIAVVRLSTQVFIFEHANGDYVPAHTAAPLQHPGGVAISGNSVLVGGNDCDDDAVVYQKGADGNWGVTGRLDDHQGSCHPEGLAVTLNGDYALVRVPNTNEAHAWRRNGSAVDWVPAGTLVVPQQGVTNGPFALQGSTAVAPGNFAFLRSGNTWNYTSRATAVDFFSTYGFGGAALVYRDGVLLAAESSILAASRAYIEISPGHFEHVATIEPYNNIYHQDISDRTVVTASQYFSDQRIDVFNLPATLKAAPPVVNDFETRNTSDLTFASGQFALAKRGSNDVLAQGSASGAALALVNDTDWTDYQHVEFDVTPNYTAGDSWVGAVVQYIDANNYYFVAVRPNVTYGIYKRVNGVDTLLAQGSYFNASPTMRIGLTVRDGQLTANIGGNNFNAPVDKSLSHGLAGFATWNARADFDDVHASATDRYLLLEKDYSPYGNLYGQDFTERGGDWQVQLDEQQNNDGLSQLNSSGDALATIGVPVENQEVTVRARLDSFGSNSGAWFGLVARYQDPKNYYSVAVRSKNQVQIRKTVNGVISAMVGAPFTPQPGQYHYFRLRLIHDQIQLFVDDVLVAGVHDATFTTGQYGLATHFAAATYESAVVFQP